MAETFVQGTRVRLAFTVEWPKGTYVDPTTVTCRVKNPAGTTSELVPAHDSLGHWSAGVTCDVPGRWVQRWEGSGAYVAAAEESFHITASEVE